MLIKWKDIVIINFQSRPYHYNSLVFFVYVDQNATEHLHYVELFPKEKSNWFHKQV